MATSSPPTRSPARDPRPFAWAALGLSRPFTVEDVHRAFREAAKSAHPDAGGDPRQFIELQRAYEMALEEAAARPADKPSQSAMAPARPLAPFVMVRVPSRTTAPSVFRALMELFAVAAFILAIFWATSMQQEVLSPPVTDEDGTSQGNAPHLPQAATLQHDRESEKEILTSGSAEHDQSAPAAGEPPTLLQIRLPAMGSLPSQDVAPEGSTLAAGSAAAGPRALALEDAQADLERALREVSRASRLMYADSRLDLSGDFIVDDPPARSSPTAAGRLESGSQRTRASSTSPSVRQQNPSSVYMGRRIPSARSTHSSFPEVENRLNDFAKRRWFDHNFGLIGLSRFRGEAWGVRTAGRPDLRFWGYATRSPADYLLPRDYARDDREGMFSTIERLREFAVPRTIERPSHLRQGAAVTPAWGFNFPASDIPGPPALPGRVLDAWLPEFPD